MKAKELREKTPEDLGKELLALKEELFKLRFQHVTNQLENPLRINVVRRDIARIKTILREQELKTSK